MKAAKTPIANDPRWLSNLAVGVGSCAQNLCRAVVTVEKWAGLFQVAELSGERLIFWRRRGGQFSAAR